MTIFTRSQIEAIQPGTLIAQGIDGRFGEPTPVTSIHAKQDDIHGKLFVCGYRQYGDNAIISFSIKEGEDDRFVRIIESDLDAHLADKDEAGISTTLDTE